MKINRPKLLPTNAKKVFSGKIFDVYQWKQKLFDGKFTIFEMLKRPDTVVIIPTTEDNKIIVQYEEQPLKGKFISFPGGRVKNLENIENEALRELEEETGYQTEKLNLFKSIQPTSKFDYMVHIFIAQKCKKFAKQKLDSGEKIEIKILTFEEVIDLFIKEKFHNSILQFDFFRAYYDSDYKKKLKRILFK